MRMPAGSAENWQRNWRALKRKTEKKKKNIYKEYWKTWIRKTKIEHESLRDVKVVNLYKRTVKMV